MPYTWKLSFYTQWNNTNIQDWSNQLHRVHSTLHTLDLRSFRYLSIFFFIIIFPSDYISWNTATVSCSAPSPIKNYSCFPPWSLYHLCYLTFLVFIVNTNLWLVLDISFNEQLDGILKQVPLNFQLVQGLYILKYGKLLPLLLYKAFWSQYQQKCWDIRLLICFRLMYII